MAASLRTLQAWLLCMQAIYQRSFFDLRPEPHKGSVLRTYCSTWCVKPDMSVSTVYTVHTALDVYTVDTLVSGLTAVIPQQVAGTQQKQVASDIASPSQPLSARKSQHIGFGLNGAVLCTSADVTE